MNDIGNLANLAGSCLTRGPAQTLNEVRQVRQGLENMKGLRKYPVIALVACVALAVLGLALSSTFLAVVGLALVGAASVAVSDCNRVCERIDHLLHEADSSALNTLRFNALLLEAKRDKNVAKEFFKSLLNNTLVLKCFF